MPLQLRILALLCFMSISSIAQDTLPATITIGDPAPPLKMQAWFKGTPVLHFEKGRVYVLEFWATWCVPCRAEMPHLSELANRYRNNVTIIGVDVYEMKKTTMRTVQAFVDSMGKNMDYTVAAGDTNLMVRNWLEATGEKNLGIPKTFVVDKKGELAWIGHPHYLAPVLEKIVNNKWDNHQELAKRNEERRLRQMDYDAYFEFYNYRDDPYKKGDTGKPDSALKFVAEVVKKEPKLKYAPAMAYGTFCALLETDPQKAYDYGKLAIETSPYKEAAYSRISMAIDIYSTKRKLPIKIYQLGLKATQLEIDNIFYPETQSTWRIYKMQAGFYWKSNQRDQAIAALQKAIENLKSRPPYKLKQQDLAELQKMLKVYSSQMSNLQLQ